MTYTHDPVAIVTAALDQLPPPESISEEKRLQILAAIDKARVALEPPLVSVQNLVFSHMGLVGVRVAVSMGIFDALAAGGESPQTLSQLAEKTKGDETLLLRILRLLTVHNLIAETAHQTWKPLPLGLGFASGSPLPEVAKHLYPIPFASAKLISLPWTSYANMKASANLDEFLEATDYQNPTDTYNGPWQFAYKTKDHYFDWLTQNPEDAHAFNVTMRINRQVEGAQWFDIYPVEGRLSVSSNDRVQLVDIGGGLGHDLAGLKRKFPNLPGRLVLEDLPDVIEHAKESIEDGIEVVGYDMFTEQPLKGAKAYYLRTVLHDWPDKQSLLALARVREAMADDSVLLINENTLPEVGASSFSVSLDMNMMNIFAALERTEKQWVDLLERAGFRVVKIWRADYDGVGSNALFEAVACQL